MSFLACFGVVGLSCLNFLASTVKQRQLQQFRSGPPGSADHGLSLPAVAEELGASK